MLGEADNSVETPVDSLVPLDRPVDSSSDVALDLELGSEMDPEPGVKVAGVEPILPLVQDEEGMEDPFVTGKGAVEVSGVLCGLVAPF